VRRELDEDFPYFYVHDTKGVMVGWVLCELTPDKALFIRDLIIFELPFNRRNGCFSLRPFQRPKKNYRKRGLGSAMLDYTILQARILGMARVEGQVVTQNPQDMPFLIDWYKRHGFIFQPGTVSFYQNLDSS
jgi:hypothetical protein